MCVQCILTAFQWGVLYFYRSKFQGEKVPTLREAVVESLQHNLTIYFDVKGHANQVPLIVLQPLLWVFSLFLLVSSWSLYHSAFSNMSENGSADCITQKAGLSEIKTVCSLIPFLCPEKWQFKIQLTVEFNSHHHHNKAKQIPCLCWENPVSDLQFQTGIPVISNLYYWREIQVSSHKCFMQVSKIWK